MYLSWVVTLHISHFTAISVSACSPVWKVLLSSLERQWHPDSRQISGLNSHSMAELLLNLRPWPQSSTSESIYWGPEAQLKKQFHRAVDRRKLRRNPPFHSLLWEITSQLFWDLTLIPSLLNHLKQIKWWTRPNYHYTSHFCFCNPSDAL